MSENKLRKMLDIASLLRVGAIIPYRDMQAKVEAFNDSHLFISIPEVAIDPDDIDKLVDGVRVRDREVENLKRQVYQLRGEIDRLLHDQRYRDMRMERERYDMRISSYPRYRSEPNIQNLKYEPPKDTYFDPLSFKRPTQQK